MNVCKCTFINAFHRSFIFISIVSVSSEPWDLQVYDVHIQRGNTAVLTCSVPVFVKDFVTITSWSRGHLNYYPSQDIGEWWPIQRVPVF